MVDQWGQLEVYPEDISQEWQQEISTISFNLFCCTSSSQHQLKLCFTVLKVSKPAYITKDGYPSILIIKIANKILKPVSTLHLVAALPIQSFSV